MKNEIILFENQSVTLEVNMKDETVWLSLEQMAELFKRDKSVISRHIKNALTEELKNEQPQMKTVTKTIELVKEDKKWKVVSNDELIDSLLPGFQEAINELG